MMIERDEDQIGIASYDDIEKVMKKIEDGENPLKTFDEQN